jgi:SAM-dependent methyltransferase
MSPALDELSLKFAVTTRSARRAALDVGCGDGLATAAALARGGHVLAIDPDQTALRKLLVRVPSQHYRRLNVRVGTLPELDFKLAQFAAVHAARVLHLLDPGDLQATLQKFFRWLYPDGKLFLSVLTPAGRCWHPFHAEYFRRRMAQERWPGFIRHPAHFLPHWTGPDTPIHLIDEPLLAREIEAAGFAIDDIHRYTLPWDSDQICCACIARCR